MTIAALVIFFLSGFAALLYQVVWQRLLVLFSGADVHSSTIIVAAFMGGLGVGSLVGGHIADRVPRRTALVLFAVAEIAIALFALLSRGLYYDYLYHRLGPLALSMPVVTAILFTSLLWPTFFMGLSLPLLARTVTDRIERAGSAVGGLYAFNTLGAATGALLATWWILPGVGLENGLRIGAGLNLICAAGALLLLGRLSTSAPPASQGLPVTPEPIAGADSPSTALATPRLPFSAWAALYALSGFMALSLEIVWFRLLGVMMKSTAFTFGTLLAIYLAGLGIGAFVGSIYATRIRRPAATFLVLQTAVGLSAGALLAILSGAAPRVPGLAQYFASYDPLNVGESLHAVRLWLTGALADGPEPSTTPLEFLALYFLLPAVLIVPPTFLMGFCFPLLQRIVQTDLSRLGRRVGLVLVANITGSVIGTMVMGWVALNLLGTAGTMRALTAVSAVFLLPFALQRRPRRAAGRRAFVASGLGLGGAAIVLAVVFGVVPSATTLWTRLHGATEDRIIFGEDASGLSVLRLEAEINNQGRTTVFVNGVGQSTIPYGDVHTALGMIPAFLHPNPRNVAVIGLGSGDTVYGMAGRQEIESITCIEIISPQLDGLRRLRARHPYGGLIGLLDDPRITHVAGDGRIVLMRAGRDFDIIEADALRPSSAYSGNLYSDAYFELVRSRLRPRGLAATWLPTARVHNAFVKVFPYVVSVPGILIGSNDPIEIDRDLIARRLAAPRVLDHYRQAGIDVEAMMAEYLTDPARYTPDFDRKALIDFNTDLFPKDEFDLGRRR